MMKKMILRGAFLGVAALLAAACFEFGNVGSKYEADILVHYEPDYYYQQEDFINQFFKGGADSVYVGEYFSTGPCTHYAKPDPAGRLLGGFALCMGVDTLAAPDRRPARFAVFDKGGYGESLAYAVFHDTLTSLMPEHAITFYIPNDDSYCSPNVVFVQNVQAVVQAVKYGNDLAGGPFTEDDFLTLTFTGSFKGNAKGSKTVKLVDGKRLLEEWTEVDLTSMSNIDALDLHLESSRPDLPLYCCIDNLYFHYLEVY